MFIDSHAHIDFAQFDSDRDRVIRRAWDNNVKTIIIPGVDGVTSERARLVTEDYPWIWFAAGWHPHDADKLDMGLLTRLAGHPKYVAIGEIGLDYYRDLSPRDVQEKAFRAQIEYSLRKGKPVILHIRDAWPDARRILEDYPALRGVFHAFSGDRDDLEWALEKGFYIGLGGPVTFNNFKKRDLIAKIPANRLLTETDCPYLTPQSHRGKRNEPAYIPEIFEKIVDFMQVEPPELEKHIGRNSIELFGISLPRFSDHPDSAKRCFSQNFLIDMNICRKIAGLAGEGAVCVEIGAGNGELTGYLTEKFERVYAIEPDWDRHEAISATAPNAVIIPQKIQSVDLHGIEIFEGEQIVVVGNLPYSETSPILFDLLDSRDSIRHIVIMAQKEFAERLTANPGSKIYGIPSVLFSAFFSIIDKFTVSPNCFRPIPNVESTVLKLTPLENPLCSKEEYFALKTVVKAAFAHRRKTITNSLKLELEGEIIDSLLAKAGISLSERAERIPPETFVKFARAYIEMGAG